MVDTTSGDRTVASVRSDAEKERALRHMKTVATGALVLCAIVFVAARSGETRWPWLGFVAAFAEAAMIGGIADWYAVVALFRRPLGLPVPHTAIIPSNQARIAENLGRFIEANFLAPQPVRAKLAQVDFAAQVADWLSRRERAAALAEFATRRAPQVLSAIERSGLKGFAARRLRDQLSKVPLTPIAAGILDTVIAEGRHQVLLDKLLEALSRMFGDERTLGALRDRIRAELPSLFNLFKADAYLLRRIVASAGAFIEEARDDPQHPLRGEFDRFVRSFVEELRESPAYAERLDRLRAEFLARPELAAMAEDLWSGLRNLVEQDLASDRSAIRVHLTAMLVEVGRSLAADPRMRAEMNAGFVDALASFVESQKGGVAEFIAGQVRRWNLGQLTRIVELNIGRDLQYIRFNGMMIGGLVGLALHVVDVFVLSN
jgi:uncharacterized membrane-anchored protein YjiN (DUF445 family)